MFDCMEEPFHSYSLLLMVKTGLGLLITQFSSSDRMLQRKKYANKSFSKVCHYRKNITQVSVCTYTFCKCPSKAIFITLSGISNSAHASCQTQLLHLLHNMNWVICTSPILLCGVSATQRWAVYSQPAQQSMVLMLSFNLYTFLLEPVPAHTGLKINQRAQVCQQQSRNEKPMFLVTHFLWKKVLIQGKCITLPNLP